MTSNYTIQPKNNYYMVLDKDGCCVYICTSKDVCIDMITSGKIDSILSKNENFADI
jgi:hypothetical protein